MTEVRFSVDSNGVATDLTGPAERVFVVPNRADRRRNHTRADQQTSPKALHVAGPRLMPRSSNPAHRKLVARLIRRATRAQNTENTE